ncbi:MAG: hypothetical protein O3A63_20870 [Proteobacteria bacterium]|nr:hypothetical protein [Pseudomonadota bacterium]
MFLVVMRIAMLMAVLTAIYIALGWYMRWDRRRRLESEHAGGADAALSREDYVTKGLAAYDRSWERKALVGIFILPILVALGVALLAYLN